MLQYGPQSRRGRSPGLVGCKNAARRCGYAPADQICLGAATDAATLAVLGQPPRTITNFHWITSFLNGRTCQIAGWSPIDQTLARRQPSPATQRGATRSHLGEITAARSPRPYLRLARQNSCPQFDCMKIAPVGSRNLAEVFRKSREVSDSNSENCETASWDLALQCPCKY